jgi:cell division septum initiation protein DivIVA
MPPAPQKDLLSRLADAGEDAINRLSEMPGASRFMDTANSLRARVDELQKRVRGLDDLERRVEKLEAQVAGLTKTAKSKSASAASASSAAKPKKPASS